MSLAATLEFWVKVAFQAQKEGIRQEKEKLTVTISFVVKVTV